jgi:hypothetical protein
VRRRGRQVQARGTGLSSLIHSLIGGHGPGIESPTAIGFEEPGLLQEVQQKAHPGRQGAEARHEAAMASNSAYRSSYLR